MLNQIKSHSHGTPTAQLQTLTPDELKARYFELRSRFDKKPRGLKAYEWASLRGDRNVGRNEMQRIHKIADAKKIDLFKQADKPKRVHTPQIGETIKHRKLGDVRFIGKDPWSKFGMLYYIELPNGETMWKNANEFEPMYEKDEAK